MKKKRILILFILLALFITGCDKKDNEIKENTNNSRELNEDEIADVMYIINNLDYMDYYNKDIVPRKLTNQEILRISYEFYMEEGSYENDSIFFSELEKIAMKYLGIGLEPENLACDTHFNIQDDGGKDILIYDVGSRVYSYNNKHVNHSTGGLKTKVHNNYVSGKVDDGVYTVKVNKLFSEIIDETYTYNKTLSYYKSYEDSKNAKNELFKTNFIDESYFIDYGNELLEFTYVFNLVDGNYILSSYIKG